MTAIMKSSENATMCATTPSIPKRVHFELPEIQINAVELLQRIADGQMTEKDETAKEKFVNAEEPDDVLFNWLHELKENISFFDRKGMDVLEVLWNFKWYKADSHTIHEYHDLLLNLISAYPYHLRQVLRVTLEDFINGEILSHDLSEEGLKVIRSKDIFVHSHELLQKLLKLVPSAFGTLISLISENFPYMLKDPKIVLSYFTNVIQVTSYLPAQRQALFELLVQKLLQIDAHCLREEIEYTEASSSAGDMMDVDNEVAERSQAVEMHHPLANLLDMLMEEMFRYIKEYCYGKDNKLNWEATKSTYKMFLAIFDKLILPTFGSCHVQFIMFYICSFDMRLSDGFIDYLWKNVMNLKTAAVIRQTAALYIGSFISRALYISASTVSACLEIFCAWIHQYIDFQSSKVHVVDPAVHFTFYTVCQSVFYIIIFRHKELMELKNGFSSIQTLNFDRIVTSSLNPLKYCQVEVVKRFASIMRHYQLAYCYTVIQHNFRCSLPVVVAVGNSLKSLPNPTVDAFFPFDPYLLKRSSSNIKPLYRIYMNQDVTKVPVDGEAATEFFQYSNFMDGIQRINELSYEH